MRRIRTILAAAFLVTLVGACATGPEREETSGGRPKARPLRTPDEEVPAAVRAIESRIDTKSALIADEVEIYCSKNYEWDVALTGDAVDKQRQVGDELVSVAEGNARATFRQLEIRAHRRIVFRRSGLDVVPFIKVSARGGAAYAEAAGGGSPAVRRASLIRIENADIRFSEDATGSPGSDARPVAELQPGLRGN